MENCHCALVSFTSSPKTGPATARPSLTGLGPPSLFTKCASAAVKSGNSAMGNFAIGPRAPSGDSRAKRMFGAPMSATTDGEAVSSLFISLDHNRSQVQGSTFRVKDKVGIKYPKSSLIMLIFPNNCQFGSKFWIRPEEAAAFVVNPHPKCSPGTRMKP